MEYNAVGWFEISVSDIERAKKFYEKVFEVTLTRIPMPGVEMYGFPMDDHLDKKGIPDALVASGDRNTGEGGVLIYFTAPDLEATIARVEPAGGKVVMQKTSIGEHGFMAKATDTEGNLIALHSTEG